MAMQIEGRREHDSSMERYTWTAPYRHRHAAPGSEQSAFEFVIASSRFQQGTKAVDGTASSAGPIDRASTSRADPNLIKARMPPQTIRNESNSTE